MSKIIFTKHALKKFHDLAELKIRISKLQVKNIILHPISFDKISDYPNIVVLGSLGKNHVLRIVYRTENDKIIIITFYPAQKGRYS